MRLLRIALLLCAVAVPGLPGTAGAADPAAGGTIRILLPQPAGSGTDVAIRLIADRMAATLRQTLVVENRVGASGAIAAEAAARAPANGQTLFACTSSTQVMLPLVGGKLAFDPQKDLAPVGIVSRADNLVVVPASSRFKTIADLIAYGRANPGKLSYGTAGLGTTHHLAAELLQQLGGFEAVHVPYKGTPLAEADLVSGRLDFMINNTAPALPNIKGGRTRALLVTSASRSPELPDTPTSREAGLQDFEVYGFTGLCAPAATPRPVVERLNAALVQAVQQPEVRSQLVRMGFDGRPTSPQEQADYIRSETARWSRVIKAKNLKFE